MLKIQTSHLKLSDNCTTVFIRQVKIMIKKIISNIDLAAMDRVQRVA